MGFAHAPWRERVCLEGTRPSTTTRWSCAVVRSRAGSVVRGRSFMVVRAWSCEVVLICPNHSTDTCLFVPITQQIQVNLSLSLHRYSLHRYMFICPYRSTDTCLCTCVPITPQIHVYLSLSLHISVILKNCLGIFNHVSLYLSMSSQSWGNCGNSLCRPTYIRNANKLVDRWRHLRRSR